MTDFEAGAVLDLLERNLVEIRRLSNRCDPESIAMIGDIAKESLDAIRQKPGNDQRWMAR